MTSEYNKQNWQELLRSVIGRENISKTFFKVYPSPIYAAYGSMVVLSAIFRPLGNELNMALRIRNLSLTYLYLDPANKKPQSVKA